MSTHTVPDPGDPQHRKPLAERDAGPRGPVPPAPPTPGQQISNAVARIYKERVGRGPTKVTTVLAHDAVVVIVEDTSTPYERTLLELGATDLVQTGRTRLQLGIAEHLVRTVEATTGHRVREHVPGFSAESGAATEVFLLDGPTATAQATEITGTGADGP